MEFRLVNPLTAYGTVTVVIDKKKTQSWYSPSHERHLVMN